MLWIFASASHPISYLLCFLQILQSHHSGVIGLDLLVLVGTVFVFDFPDSFAVHVFYHFDELLPLFFVYFGQVAFLDCLLYVLFHFLFLFKSCLAFFLFLVDIVAFQLIVGAVAIILGLNLLLVFFEFSLHLLYLFPPYSLFFCPYLLVFLLVVLYGLTVQGH